MSKNAQKLSDNHNREEICYLVISINAKATKRTRPETTPFDVAFLSVITWRCHGFHRSFKEVLPRTIVWIGHTAIPLNDILKGI